MTVNPLLATKKTQNNYFSFYESIFAMGNDELLNKLKGLKKNNRLWRSPFVNIVQNYEFGKTNKELQEYLNIDENVIKSLHIDNFFMHQELAIVNILKNKRNTIISSGTGSGKTESFLIPILNTCANSNEFGIKAILVYPMNALANDQVIRLRKCLFELNSYRKKQNQKEITFALYNGTTPENSHNNETVVKELNGVSLPCPSCGKNSLACKYSNSQNRSILYCKNELNIEINFQMLSRNDIFKNPPDILITSHVMLDRILMRKQNNILFNKNKIQYVVLDELHAYYGISGIDVSIMMRRLKNKILKNKLGNSPIQYIGTSATMSKSNNDESRKSNISNFAKKIFNEDFSNLDIIEGIKNTWKFPSPTVLSQYEPLKISDNVDENFEKIKFNSICKQITGKDTPSIKNDKLYLGKILLTNDFFQFLIKILDNPKSIEEIKKHIMENKRISSKIKNIDNPSQLDNLIWSYLKAGSMSHNPHNTSEFLIQVSIHNFFRSMPSLYMCTNQNCRKIFYTDIIHCDSCNKLIDELAVCRNCNKEFYISIVSKNDLKQNLLNNENNELLKGTDFENSEKYSSIRRSINTETNELWYSVLNPDIQTDNTHDIGSNHTFQKCLDCGCFFQSTTKICTNEIDGQTCGSASFINVEAYPPKSNKNPEDWRPRDCPFCHHNYGNRYAITTFYMTGKQSAVNLFNMLFDDIPNHKLLIFSDTRQDASELSAWLDIAHDDTIIKQLILKKINKLCSEENYVRFEKLSDSVVDFIEEEWYNYDLESYSRSRDEIKRKILLEIASYERLSLERFGLIQYDYRGLDDLNKFISMWKSYFSEKKIEQKLSIKINSLLNLQSISPNTFNKFIITTLHMIRTNESIQGLEDRSNDHYRNAHGFELDITGNNKSIIDAVAIHNIISNRFITYAKKVFDINNEDTRIVLQYIWDFILKHGFIILRPLKGRRYKNSVLGHVISTNRLLLSIPTMIQMCPECKMIYTNLPDNKCRNFSRQKICHGITKVIKYEAFCAKNDNSYFFNMFKNNDPQRMIVSEHTGAIPPQEREQIQHDFTPSLLEDRKQDVLVCTPTLELGVDIGDLSSVGLYRSPPSPASYLQRIGRAGRKDGVAFINTFLSNRFVDEFYYRHPEDLISGNFNPPILNIKNRNLIIKHINSLILEYLNSSILNNFLMKNIGNFLTNKDEYFKLLSLDLVKENNILIDIIHELLISLNIKNAGDTITALDFISKFKTNFKHIVIDLEKKLESYDYVANSINSNFPNVQKNEQHKKSILSSKLETYLYNVNFLPNFGLSNESVIVEDIYGNEIYGGRSKQIAITEFTPQSEITYKKKKYQSAGIDMTSVEQLNIYTCDNCENLYDVESLLGKKCPYCKSIINNNLQIKSLSPKKIFVKRSDKALSYIDNYNEVKLEIFLPNIVEKMDVKIINIGNYEITITKFGNIKLLMLIKNILTNSRDKPTPFSICNDCGKLLSTKKHKSLKTFSRPNQYCNGISQHLSLHHTLPTNVISVKIINKKDPIIDHESFLTTLKSAIIFAGQIICQSLDGEINGSIKQSELILYDNIHGGVGYVDVIYEKFQEVLSKAYTIINDEYDVYGEQCVYGCMRCLLSYRNSYDAQHINKQIILPLLKEC